MSSSNLTPDFFLDLQSGTIVRLSSPFDDTVPRKESVEQAF
jgi:hypothetical protein